ARKTATAAGKGMVHSTPVFARHALHGARNRGWPATVTFEVSICPSQDLFDSELLQPAPVANSPLFGEQLRKRRVARKTAASVFQGKIDCTPGYPQRAKDLPRI